MEIILTVLITLGVVSLIGAVVGVMRLNRRVDDLEVARMDIDDDILRLRNEVEDDIEHIHREMGRDKDTHIRNLDKRLDNVWSEIHKLDKTINPNMDLIK
jgi:predicted RNase H-like nuclease (RuvC/YqgF family)